MLTVHQFHLIGCFDLILPTFIMHLHQLFLPFLFTFFLLLLLFLSDKVRLFRKGHKNLNNLPLVLTLLSKNSCFVYLNKWAIFSNFVAFSHVLKFISDWFIYSEKATKLWEIFTSLLSYVVPVVKILWPSQNI